MKKYLIIGLALLQMIAICACSGKETGVLSIGERESIAEITFSNGSETNTITDEAEKDALFSILSEEMIKEKGSYYDTPQVNTYITVDFKRGNKAYETVYVYEKGGRFFAEQPYNGIFSLTEEEYNVISGLLEK